LTRDKILLVNSRELCYYSGSFFLQQMCVALRNVGEDAEYVTLSDEDDFIAFMDRVGKSYKAIIDINSQMPYMILEDESRLLNRIDAPFYNYIVDHPLYHHPGLVFPIDNYHAIGIDKRHVKYMKDYYPHLKSVGFLPMGATEPSYRVDYKKRQIPLLLTATYENEQGILQDFRKLAAGLEEGRFDINYEGNYKPDAATQDDENGKNHVFGGGISRSIAEAGKSKSRGQAFFDLGMNLAETMLSGPVERTMEECLADIISQEDLMEGKYYTREFPVLMNYLFLVDKYVRNVHRRRVVEEIVKSGREITVAGAGWGMTALGDYARANLIGQVQMMDVFELMGDAKTVLDINPLFVEGVHDRVTSAMAAGAYVISDMNVDALESDESILGQYNIWKLDKLQEALNLTEPEKADRAYMGYELYKESYSWDCQANNLLKLLKD